MLHAGTLVVHGTGRAVVVATGAASQLGRIARMLHEHAAPATPLQRRLAALGRRALAAGDGLLHHSWWILGLVEGRPWEPTVLAAISGGRGDPGVAARRVTLALAGGTRRMASAGRSSARCPRWRPWAR